MWSRRKKPAGLKSAAWFQGVWPGDLRLSCALWRTEWMWLYSLPLRRQAAHTLIRTVFFLHTAVLHQAPLQRAHSSLPFTYLGAQRQRSCSFYNLSRIKARKCATSTGLVWFWLPCSLRFSCKIENERTFLTFPPINSAEFWIVWQMLNKHKIKWWCSRRGWVSRYIHQ